MVKGKFSSALADRLRHHRIHCGMTQQQLADRIGVIPQCISSYEHGRTMPNVERLALIARALGCHVCDLVPEAPDA